VRALAKPVCDGEVDMTRGVFDGGRWMTTAAQHLAPQPERPARAPARAAPGGPGTGGSRYGVEVAITNHARRQRWRTRDVSLAGVTQVMKEEKRGWWQGQRVRWAMYRDIVGQALRQLRQRHAPKR
jgi:hypothetical protein